MGYIAENSTFFDFAICPTRFAADFDKLLFKKEEGSRTEMNAKEAVAKRILQLCDERNMPINALANISGVAPSTVYSMLNEKSQNPGIISIQKLCDGFEITTREFFDSELFENIEQEIK